MTLRHHLSIAQLLNRPASTRLVASANMLPRGAAKLIRCANHRTAGTAAATHSVLTDLTNQRGAGVIARQQGFNIEAVVAVAGATDRKASPLVTARAFIAGTHGITLTVIQTSLAHAAWRTSVLTWLASGELAASVETQFVSLAGARLQTQSPDTEPGCVQIDALVPGAYDTLAGPLR